MEILNLLQQTRWDLTHLERVMPPPVTASGVPSAADLAALATLVGGVPEDYASFIRKYGVGVVGDALGIVSLWGEDGKQFVDEFVEGARLNREGFGRSRFPLFPEAEGIFPFAVTENGDYVGWWRRGAPEEWPVVALNWGDAVDGEFHPGNFVSFLGWYTDEHTASLVIPFPSAERGFGVRYVPL